MITYISTSQAPPLKCVDTCRAHLLLLLLLKDSLNRLHRARVITQDVHTCTVFLHMKRILADCQLQSTFTQILVHSSIFQPQFYMLVLCLTLRNTGSADTITGVLSSQFVINITTDNEGKRERSGGLSVGFHSAYMNVCASGPDNVL